MGLFCYPLPLHLLAPLVEVSPSIYLRRTLLLSSYLKHHLLREPSRTSVLAQGPPHSATCFSAALTGVNSLMSPLSPCAGPEGTGAGAGCFLLTVVSSSEHCSGVLWLLGKYLPPVRMGVGLALPTLSQRNEDKESNQIPQDFTKHEQSLQNMNRR